MNEPTANLDINKAAATAASAHHLHRAILGCLRRKRPCADLRDLVRIDPDGIAATDALAELATAMWGRLRHRQRDPRRLPFLPTPSLILVSWDEHVVHAMCAVDARGVDALGVPAAGGGRSTPIDRATDGATTEHSVATEPRRYLE